MSRTIRVPNDNGPVPGLIALGGLAWVLLLTLAPLLPVAAAGFAYVLGSVICHQISERSFHLDGGQLPVCARCLGIYAGFAASACALSLAGLTARGGGVRQSLRAAPLIRRLVLAGAVPTLVTVAAEWTALWQPSNLTRALAGAPLGLAVAVVVAYALTAGRERVRSAGEPSQLAAH